MTDTPATPAPQADPGPAAETPSQEPQGSALQTRIDRLTRQRYDAERTAQAAVAQNESLVLKLAELTDKVERLSASQSVASPSAFDRALAAPQAASSKNGQPTDIAALVQNAVQTALRPLQEDRQQQELLGLQQNSFHQGATLLPEMLQANSAAQQLFNQLWEGSPGLQKEPNGPEKVIAMVKGLLATTASPAQLSHAQTVIRKTAASAPAPGQNTFRAAVAPNQKALNEQKIEELVAKGSTLQGLTDDEWTQLVGLKLGRANMQSASV